MLIRKRSDIRPSEITPESIYRARRRLLAIGATLPWLSLPACSKSPSSNEEIKNDIDNAFTEEMTTFRDASNYNNFYEFGADKNDPAKYAHRLRTSPWSVEIAGHAERVGSFALEDLIRPHQTEERVYRLRCVEGWSMVIPWLGFPLSDLLARFKPTSKAKYVAFTTLADPQQMPGVRTAILDWPYREGLRIDEAMHPLALLAVGMYGQPLPNQNGAPLRLVVPWKYGFKSIKSIIKIEFMESQPLTSWNLAQPREYGFYSNVNPNVNHPRWSQKTERRIAGTATRLFANRIATHPFNGYGEQVASLYTGMDLREFF